MKKSNSLSNSKNLFKPRNLESRTKIYNEILKNYLITYPFLKDLYYLIVDDEEGILNEDELYVVANSENEAIDCVKKYLNEKYSYFDLVIESITIYPLSNDVQKIEELLAKFWSEAKLNKFKTWLKIYKIYHYHWEP